MMSAKLSLSISTQWMLNSSTLSMITIGSSLGCLMPQPSFFKKTISGSSFFGIFIGGSHEWILFISLLWAFFRDFSVPPAVSPPEIVFISPTGGLLSPAPWFLSWSSFHWYLWGSVFLTYFCNFPCRIKVSIWFFKCLHLSVQCLWSWWNLQYLFLSLLSAGVLIDFGHYREGSSLICIRTCSVGIIRGVKLVNFGFLSGSSFFFSVVYPTLRDSFFLLWLLLVPLSLFLFPSFLASTTSSALMYFWAFWSNSATVFGGLLVIEKKKSPSSNPAWKVVSLTWSSISSTCCSSLLNRVTYCLNDSPSVYWMLRR